jgi:hypothetical protein
MIKVDVKVTNSDAVRAMLAGQQRQIPFAAAVALTRTAKTIMDEQQGLLPAELDRPKPATVRALRMERATKANLTATVRFKERGEGVPAADFLGHNIAGGRRGMKRSELMLQAAGILPGGMLTIPGTAARLDAYGNMSRGQIVSILSYFRTFGTVTSGGKKINSGRMNRATKSRAKPVEYFVVPPGGRMPAGIWQRTATQAKPVLMFVKPGSHRKLVKFHETAQRVVARDWTANFNRALDEALRSAR